MPTATETHIPRKRKGAAVSPMPWWGDRGPAPHVQWPKRTVEIPAVWSTARSRWESPDGRFYFDDAAADRAERFFSDMLVHHIGEFAGQPFVLMEYQRKLLTRPLFGWKRAQTGIRRFSKLFAFLPKGAGKSPWGAGTALYTMGFDEEPAAEVYVVAADREQARVVHDNAKVMVEGNDELAEYFEIQRDAIFHRGSRSTLKVLSSDASTKHGFRPHVVILDEMHAQKNRDLYEALRKSMAKRRQPIMGMITHSGVDDEGICYEEYEYAKGVLTGAIEDPSTLPVIFEMQPTDNWTDPAVWAATNPGHGITIKHDAIEQECQEAMVEPRKRNDFLRYHLNVWTNQAEAWMPGEWWDRCPSPLPSDDVLRGLDLAAGFDMAQKIDLASLVLTFKEPLEAPPLPVAVTADNPMGVVEKREVSLNYRIHVLPMFWIDEETMRERELRDRVPYSEWANQGWVTVTEGNVIDDDRIFKDIVKLADRFPKLRESEIGYDPAFATSLALRLLGKGFKAVEVLQNYRHMSEPCHVLEAMTRAGRVTHDGNRCMRRCVENVAIKTDDAGRIRPVKPKKQAKRIDGVVAALMGLGRLIANAEKGGEPQFFILGGTHGR